MELHEYEIILLNFLKNQQEYKDNEIKCQLSGDALKRTIGWLNAKGLITVHSQVKIDDQTLSKEGKIYMEQGFPEYLLAGKAIQKSIGIKELTPEEKMIGIQWAKKKGWITIENGKVVSTVKELPKQYKPDKKEMIERGLIIVKKHEFIKLSLTNKGVKVKKMIDKGEIEHGGIKLLTSSMIKSKSWQDKKFMKYNVTAESEEKYPGKRHVLSRFSKKIKNIFTDLGFEEMEGPILESSFWVFDALFQPQDHPAREMADTFYTNTRFTGLPKELVTKIKYKHETGWDYKWSQDISEQGVLRCHTTSLSVKKLYETKDKIKPGKYFSIGKVYRNEAIDYKHLAEFHQVEGIIVDDNIEFKHLLGVLKEFYKRLGFEKIKFYPAYFPYTEPSVEVFVYFPEKKEWIEMGGAGIFRPEVSETLCGRYPVLAFGLSLERPLLLLTDMKDIRMFYKNKIDWLRDMKLSQID